VEECGHMERVNKGEYGGCTLYSHMKTEQWKKKKKKICNWLQQYVSLTNFFIFLLMHHIGQYPAFVDINIYKYKIGDAKLETRLWKEPM
jgi:hypothetical protein